LTKIGHNCYLFNKRAWRFVIFSIEAHESILLQGGIERVAPETMEPVEWKILFAVDMLKYEAFILWCD
jgi:hypothetical protein